ncbi:hypothetical protein SAMN05216276_11136 [Streptosporangium subroseum]|uniref:Uncharacterized protein n=1 Tax=Streptosporangium subroseum TaxID=106412 RepID=A0A239PCR7_9ACTN|nr:hypothetical protein SAMN05216276_11136 [Streptosporangium subroseum]
MADVAVISSDCPVAHGSTERTAAAITQALSRDEPRARAWHAAARSKRPAAETLGLDNDGWVLVRPDGYLTARGYGQDRLDHAYHRLPL